jgi:hypothetical protein
VTAIAVCAVAATSTADITAAAPLHRRHGHAPPEENPDDDARRARVTATTTTQSTPKAPAPQQIPGHREANTADRRTVARGPTSSGRSKHAHHE